jgi:hypothetical protein
MSNMSLLKNVAENFGGSFQENQFQVNKVTCNLYLYGSLKDKVYKTNPHILEDLTNNRHEISTTPGEEFQRVKATCSADILSTFGQEGKILSTCCSSGEILLDFLQVIITAIVRVATFTDFCPSRHAAYAATLAERLAAASRSSRK